MIDFRELTDYRIADANKRVLGKTVKQAEADNPDHVIREMPEGPITLESCFNRINVIVENNIIVKVSHLY